MWPGVWHGVEITCTVELPRANVSPSFSSFVQPATPSFLPPYTTSTDAHRFLSSTVTVLSTPCHTAGHICYLVDGNVFTGDTMFVSGCGNFNSGTPAQMASAFQKILALPDETLVWVGHEYTCKNCNCSSIHTNFLFRRRGR